jgi:gliding motility associated protien GldN
LNEIKDNCLNLWIKKIFLILIISYFWSASAQQPSGIFQPYQTNEFTVVDCFKNIDFLKIIRNDSMKSNSVMIGHTIWRTISLDNNINKGLLNTKNGCLQIGLFEIIKFGIFEKLLNGFESDNFGDVQKTVLSRSTIMKKIKLIDTVETKNFDDQGNEKTTIETISKYLNGNDIKIYLLKENWIMNSYTGEFEKRIIAFSPLVFNKNKQKVLPVFWLYFNEWEDLLSNFKVVNPKNDEVTNYRDLFTKSHFVSKISKVNNLADRSINSTNKGTDNYLESEMIKEKIINQESDFFHN